jgi:hypothetical protein
MVVTVRLAIVGGSPSAVEMFVPDVPRRGRGQLFDDLATQLDGEARFVPVRTTSRVRLVGKHAIAWISIERREAGGGDPEDSADGSAGGAGGSATGGIERREAGGGDPDGSAGGAGGSATRGIDRREPEEAPAAPGEIPEELTLFDHQHFVEVELAHGAKLIGTLLDSAPAEHARVGDHLNHLGRWLRLWTTDQHYLINVQQVVAVTELGETW